MGGGKTDKTCLSILEYYPTQNKIFLSRLFDRIKTEGEVSADLQVHSLIDDSALQDDALALVRALRANFPGTGIVVPALQREDLGGAALRRAGFAPQELHQVLMVRRG